MAGTGSSIEIDQPIDPIPKLADAAAKLSALRKQFEGSVAANPEITSAKATLDSAIKAQTDAQTAYNTAYARVQTQQANRNNPRFGGGNTSGKADKMSDIVKDIWGHLPETLRQEVDHYYRDQFMPRYRDLLQQYYSRLAEQERRARDGR